MSKRERAKGARFERQVAHALGTERIGTRGKRDAEHADVKHDRFYVQCKHYKRIRVCRWYEETAERAKEVGKTPVVVLKEDRGQPLVLISLQDFLEMTKEGAG